MIGGLSMTEVIIILGLALLLLGPDQLPQLAKSLGKGLREIRKATDDLKGQFEQEIARIDIDEKPHAMIAPVPTPAADPAEARAIARNAASAPPAPAPVAAPADPGEARAAARRAAAESAKLKLVAPEGAVPREEPASPAAEPGSAQQPGPDS
jgi:sec-independent protein translocase protein TatB